MSVSDNANNNPNQDANPSTRQMIQPPPPINPVPVKTTPIGEFPSREQIFRIQDYDYYNRLFMGDHFGAFNIRVGDEGYTREYSKLRYVMANFAGLISKVGADMLFSEAPDFDVPDGDQEFLDALIHENNLHTQNYESALSNSYNGDALYKIRVGKRFPTDKLPTVIIEDITPTIYFPELDGFNVRQEPNSKALAWTFKVGDQLYLRKEIHTPGLITNEVYKMEGTKIMEKVSPSVLGLPDSQDTGIDRSLIIHIPNWKTGNRYFGISDYADLDRLFYAINNRLTKTDNILDKHGDPILTVPPGILDEKGKVRKKALGVIEMADGETGKPEYVVWDASLDSAFKSLEKMIETLFMVAEISPDVLGMGTGQADSGRAIKLKMMRTIAKVARKKLYYDRGLKEVLFVAQLMAKQWNLQVGGLKLTKEPAIPNIEWQDGIPLDEGENIDNIIKRVDANLMSQVDAIASLDDLDEDDAEEKAKEIREENKLNMPPVVVANVGGKSFGPNDPRSQGGSTSGAGAGGNGNGGAGGNGVK